MTDVVFDGETTITLNLICISSCVCVCVCAFMKHNMNGNCMGYEI